MSYFTPRGKENATGTGTGNLTLTGAFTDCRTIATDVQVGDPWPYLLIPAAGGYELGEATLLTSTTFSRDTVDASSNSDALVSLAAGTHTVEVNWRALDANKRMVEADAFIDYVVSGLQVPTTSANLTGSTSLGIAYVVGRRIVKGAQPHTYTLSKDTYVDLNHQSVLTYVEVANGATTGMPVTANSIRLGKVVTNGTVIASGTSTGFDPLGNPMGNTIRAPTCMVVAASNITVATGNTPVAFTYSTAAEEKVNNDGMHSISVNNSRITITRAGLYAINFFVEYIAVSTAAAYTAEVFKNGTALGKTQQSTYATATNYPCVNGSALDVCAAGDYFELKTVHGSPNSETGTGGTLSVNKIG